jgi:[ribosomal protein S18]-alanine N-acetyltransferase
MAVDCLTTCYCNVQSAQVPLLSAALPSLLAGDWNEAALQALCRSPHQLRVLLQSPGQELIGFAEFQPVLDECQLFSIAVLPAWQQRGYGTLLLQAVLEEAKTQALRHCVLEVRESNLAARRLYSKLGFSPIGKRKDYYPPLSASGDREAAMLYSLSW